MSSAHFLSTDFCTAQTDRRSTDIEPELSDLHKTFLNIEVNKHCFTVSPIDTFSKACPTLIVTGSFTAELQSNAFPTNQIQRKETPWFNKAAVFVLPEKPAPQLSHSHWKPWKTQQTWQVSTWWGSGLGLTGLCCVLTAGTSSVTNMKVENICFTAQTCQVWLPEMAAGWRRQRYWPAGRQGRHPAGPALWPPSLWGLHTPGWWRRTVTGSQKQTDSD